MVTYFRNCFNQINLWNRTRRRAETFRDELNELFPNIKIVVMDSSVDCVRDADVIVTATNSSVPLFKRSDLCKSRTHINGKALNISQKSFI